MPESTIDFDSAVDRLLSHCGGDIVLAAPLGLGKPHRLLNAIYSRVKSDPAQRLQLLTALSLDPPSPAPGLERRFLQPFAERQFGADFSRLEYVIDQKRGQLPANVRIEEFYLQSGSLLGKPAAQLRYNSLNYTHVARAVAERGVKAVVQLVAREPGGSRISMSCNTDLTQDLLAEVERRGGARPLMIAEVHPELPWIGGSAAVDADFFDLVLDPPGPAPKLFALPRQPVGDAEYAIGILASALVRDGGTLQIGIGALSDALCHALRLRHTSNDEYLALLAALAPGLAASPLVREYGGTGPFAAGLYGASEMLMDGFAHLVDCGVIRRRVVDDAALMQREIDGHLDEIDRERIEREGQYLHGGFYLGSHDFYRWLRERDPQQLAAIGMTRISHINELYGNNETLERLQRRHARFFNTCMMATALGAVVSDALDSGQVVSGVGGQYNFVAMAHALPDARSVLMLRATRSSGGHAQSTLLWNYGHTTIPRHLRDILITEYGIANLRGVCDEDCVREMLAVCDARFAPELLRQAREAGKCIDAQPPAATGDNIPAHLQAKLAPFRNSGLLPDYPLGSDFTEVEERLVRALGWLKANTASRSTRIGTVVQALLHRGATDDEALQRMQLASPDSLGERVEAALLRLALARTSAGPRAG